MGVERKFFVFQALTFALKSTHTNFIDIGTPQGAQECLHLDHLAQCDRSGYFNVYKTLQNENNQFL